MIHEGASEEDPVVRETDDGGDRKFIVCWHPWGSFIRCQLANGSFVPAVYQGPGRVLRRYVEG